MNKYNTHIPFTQILFQAEEQDKISDTLTTAIQVVVEF